MLEMIFGVMWLSGVGGLWVLLLGGVLVKFFWFCELVSFVEEVIINGLCV